jgi:phosphoribosylformylglycinamidine synthase
VIGTILEAIRTGHVRSAHDCSEGGLAVAIAESCMGDRAHPTGATIDLTGWGTLASRALLFGEAQGRIVVSTAHADAVLAIAQRHGVPARVIGTVAPAAAGLRITTAQGTLTTSIDRLATAYHEAIPRAMARAAAETVTETAGGTR